MLIHYIKEFTTYLEQVTWIPMITLVLHNSALELVNEKVCNCTHQAILNDAKRRKKKSTDLLLDLAVHQSAIYPEQVHNSGRPDLVHLFLLQYHHIMKLLPEQSTNINLYVHTKNDELFYVPQSWRVPVHFIRFRGLMEKFLKEKRISLSESEQLELAQSTLLDLIKQLAPDTIINLTDQGSSEPELLRDIQFPDSKKKLVVLIGGYQRGEDTIPKYLNKKIMNVKLTDNPTTAWMILNILYAGTIIEKENKKKNKKN